jgi:hypothetical protein
VPDQRRVQATLEKTQGGGLPPSRQAEPAISVGDGRPCDGCAETIHPTELVFDVAVGAGRLRFHDVCFHAWDRASKPS